MKIACLTDSHWGARNDSLLLYDHFEKFYSQVFFPYLKDHGIKQVIHLGDCFDRRKFVNYRTLDKFVKIFIEPSRKLQLRIHFLVGNHDTFFKNTNELNSLDALIFPDNYMKIYKDCEEVIIDNQTFLYIPWINKDNEEQTFKMIHSSKAKTAFGHLELSGFKMYKNYTSEQGMDCGVFDKFNKVFSGHYHHKSDDGKIFYLGAPYEITQNDQGDPRGFHVYDTVTEELEYIRNPHILFVKLFYNDDRESYVPDKKFLKDKIVKIIVEQKNDLKKFDAWIHSINRCEPNDIVIVEDFSKFHKTNVDVAEIDIEDTMDFLGKYVNGMKNLPELDRTNINDRLKSIYVESANLI